MSQLPESILIGTMRYEVKEVDDLHFVDDKGVKQSLYGNINYPYGEIRINTDQCFQRKVFTLAHEVIHGILTGSGIEESHEDVVRTLGFGIVNLLRDNPDLADFFISTDPRRLPEGSNG